MQKAEYMPKDIGFRIQETGFRIKESGFRNSMRKLFLIEFFVNKKICSKRLQLRSSVNLAIGKLLGVIGSCTNIVLYRFQKTALLFFNICRQLFGST